MNVITSTMWTLNILLLCTIVGIVLPHIITTSIVRNNPNFLYDIRKAAYHEEYLKKRTC